MRPLRRFGRWLVTHKRGEEEAAVVVDAAWLAWRLAGALGLGASVASAAVLAPGLIDLSNNNGSRAAVAISAPGVQAVEAKATEGLAFRDRAYPTFRRTAARAHRPFGGYMFIHPGESGAAQARYFLAYAKPKPGDIQPVVDSETGSPAAAAHATYAALHELELHGYRPLLYASSYYLKVLVETEPRLKRFRAWQAEYGPTLHTVAGMTTVAWQFTDRARAAGVSLDGSHLLVRNVRTIEFKPAPLKPERRKTGCRRVR